MTYQTPIDNQATPTEAKALLVNYQEQAEEQPEVVKIKVDYMGIPVYITAVPGDYRNGFYNTFFYGKIPGTISNEEGEEKDVILGPYKDITTVFLIEITNEDGSFNEQKVGLGFKDQKEMQSVLRNQYPDCRLGLLTETTIEGLKQTIAQEQLKMYNEQTRLAAEKETKEVEEIDLQEKESDDESDIDLDDEDDEL